MIIAQLDRHDVGLQVVNVTIQDSEPPTVVFNIKIHIDKIIIAGDHQGIFFLTHIVLLIISQGKSLDGPTDPSAGKRGVILYGKF